DEHSGTVRMLDPGLRPSGRFGTLGDEPGQLVRPQALVPLASGDIGIYDHAGPRLEVFGDKGDGYRFLKRIELFTLRGSYGQAMCGFQDGFYIRGTPVEAAYLIN